MKNYKRVFQLNGFIAFLTVMLPNIVWIIYPPSNDVLSKNKNISDFAILNIFMLVSQWIMIATLILLCRTEKIKRKADKFYIAACAVSLCVYYAFWICYYMKTVSPFIFLDMAFFPCSFFVFFAIWQNNIIALFPTALFSVLHIGITYTNFT